MSRVELVYFRGSEDERKLMRCAYAMLEREGSARRMFMDGTVRSAEEFEKDLFRTGSLPFLVLHDGQPCGVSWLNTLEGRAARGHYAVFRRYWGRKCPSPSAGAFLSTISGSETSEGICLTC